MATVQTATLHTSFKLLRQAGACKERYRLFRRAMRARGYEGDTELVPLSLALETNGLDDTLWALQAVPPGEWDEARAFIARLAVDFAEHVGEGAAAWAAAGAARDAARDTARDTARATAWAAADTARAAGIARAAVWDVTKMAAGDAVWMATWDAEREWQAQLLRRYLTE